MPRVTAPLPHRRRAGPVAAALTVLLAAACDAPAPFREVRVDLADRPAAAQDPAPGPARALRFSVAAVESPKDTYADYARLFRLVGERLGTPVEFVQRRTYREVNDLLAAGELDAALVCTGGYLDLVRRAPGAVELVAAPRVEGRLTYQALVVVPARSPARTLADLVGKRFAYTDELSFSGHAYVRRYVAGMGQDPDRFFGSVVFTRSHDRSLAAVAQGLADGAAVHSGVYRHVRRKHPELADRLRVVHVSPSFGAMPVVASTRLPPEVRARLAAVLTGLAADPAGAQALEVLGIEAFEVPPPGLYDEAARVVEAAR
jgi:phosphonate transport system substrate-binding protein